MSILKKAMNKFLVFVLLFSCLRAVNTQTSNQKLISKIEF